MRKKVFAAIVTILIVFFCASNVSYAMEVTEKNVVTYEDGVTPLIINETNRFYNKISKEIKNNFENNGWKIVIPSEKLYKKFNDSSIFLAGQIHYKEKIIYMNNGILSPSVVLHEMGHYVDYENSFISDSEEFEKIYNKEVKNFRIINCLADPHNTEDAREYFAEFYGYTILFPELAKMTCPETYEFVMKYANTIN